MSDHTPYLCIHGHFYQPPREDPWLGAAAPEGSAGPAHDWNQRICRESYAPLSRARILGHDGRIREIVNCYQYLSFNFGPTLMHWLERHDPATYGRVLEGDNKSRERLGHGNAMAQIQHHAIMPLASERDKKTETAWAVADFSRRFGRDPDGMWLSEAAVDYATLDVLAQAGIRFTVLAPSQARAVTDDHGHWRDVDEGGLDISRPYQVDLPSGRSMAVFFYNGGISQAVAFERLLTSGETFLSRLAGAAHPGLLSLATDGETYGHHFTFGEMALAYVLTRIRDDGGENAGGLRLTNFAAFLAANPPVRKAAIHEPSSWSCVHGVERWRADCGCNTGGFPGFNQAWRAPLREALDDCRSKVDKHFYTIGKDLFKDPGAALVDYGRVVADPGQMDSFAAKHFAAKSKSITAWQLLLMQRHSLASMASCAWFFDDLDRLEPINAMRNACRAMELMRDTGGADLEPQFVQTVAKARSNREHHNSGEDFYRELITPARESAASIIAQALAGYGQSIEPGQSLHKSWPFVSARVTADAAEEAKARGTAEIAWPLEAMTKRFIWSAELGTHGLLDAAYRAVPADEADLLAKAPALRPDGLTWPKRQALGVALAARAEQGKWELDLETARLLAASTLPLSESQERQNQEWTWGRFRAALVYLFVTGEADSLEGREALAHFLRNETPCEPEKEAVRIRTEAVLMELLRQEPPKFQAVAGIIERAREIGLDLDLWAAQNIIWDTYLDKPEAQELMGILNMGG